MTLILKLISVLAALADARTPEAAGWAVRSGLVWPGMTKRMVTAVMGHPSISDSGGPPGQGYTCYTYGPVCITFQPHDRVWAVRP